MAGVGMTRMALSKVRTGPAHFITANLWHFMKSPLPVRQPYLRAITRVLASIMSALGKSGSSYWHIKYLFLKSVTSGQNNLQGLF